MISFQEFLGILILLSQTLEILTWKPYNNLNPEIVKARRHTVHGRHGQVHHGSHPPHETVPEGDDGLPPGGSSEHKRLVLKPTTRPKKTSEDPRSEAS